MKKLIFFVFVWQFANVAGQELKFKNPKYNFGFVQEGDTVNMYFEFENTGTEPLIVSDYKVECGCTAVEKPTKTIMPHEKSKLKITFDTHQKFDRQDRTVEIVSNAKNSPSILRFKGVVLKPKKKN